MPQLRDSGPYIYLTWLPKLLAGLDRCEWKIWFQVHHDGRTWEKLESDFNVTRYNIEHTELVRLCTEEYEARGFSLTYALCQQQPGEPPRLFRTLGGCLFPIAASADKT